MIEFEEAYSDWRRQPFPTGSHLDALDELHADLALAHAWVAESVIPFIERGRVIPAKVDVIGTLREIRGRSAELAETLGGDESRLAKDYVVYAHLLELVYEGFLSRSGSGGGTPHQGGRPT